MAHKKGASSTRNGRDSNAQRLGVKASAAEATTRCSRWWRDMLSSVLDADAGLSM